MPSTRCQADQPWNRWRSTPNYHYNWAGVDAPAHTSLVLEKLGFQIVNTLEEADVVILESNRFDASIFGKKPTLVIGGEAMQKLEKLGVLTGFDAEKLKGGSDYEGLMKVDHWWPRIHWPADTEEYPLLLQLRKLGLKVFKSISRPWWASPEWLLYCRLGHIMMC